MSVIRSLYYQQLFKSRSTLTKTVILPAGVRLNDQRLAEGIVVSERKYMMPAGVLPEWPEDTPFECDVDGRLLPPCWGKQKLHAHYAVSHALSHVEHPLKLWLLK